MPGLGKLLRRATLFGLCCLNFTGIADTSIAQKRHHSHHVHRVALKAEPLSRTAPPRLDATPAAAEIASTGRIALKLSVGAGRVITLQQPASSLFAADPKVAEVRPASPTSLFVFGVAPGRTTIAALTEGGKPVAEIDLTVTPSSYGSGEVATLVHSNLHFPGVQIAPTPGGYTITGHVQTPADAERILTTLRAYLAPGQTIDNRLSVDTPLTVTLQVRVVEVQRTVTRELGIN